MVSGPYAWLIMDQLIRQEKETDILKTRMLSLIERVDQLENIIRDQYEINKRTQNVKSDRIIELEQLLKEERINNLKLSHDLLNKRVSYLEAQNKVIDTRNENMIARLRKEGTIISELTNLIK